MTLSLVTPAPTTPSLTPPAPQLPVIPLSDAIHIMLARELAANIRPLDDVLSQLKITPEGFEQIKANPRFQALLESIIVEWEAVSNTMERTKIKAAAMIEDWLPEAHSALHDRAQPLSSRVELSKVVARMAGIGEKDITATGIERVSVTINLGGDTQLKFDKNKTIEPQAPQ